jgi:branched-subunit amino acid aminotransferase/4-amino-4-deoxychorismate lyase
MDHELLSVRVDIFSGIAVTEPTRPIEDPDILVTARALTNESLSPLRIQSVQYQRDLPQVKHAGTFGLNYHYRQAQLNGFDDALFTDTTGLVSEGTGWNIGFFDGEKIIWPKAPVLPGISMQLIQTGLRHIGMPFEFREIWLHDLPTFRSAFLTDVLVGAQSIASIDNVTFSVDSELNSILTKCYDINPAVEV